MMDDNELTLKAWRYLGRLIGQDLQMRSPDMSPTEVVDEEVFLPMFDHERQYLNYDPGYICKTKTGNVVKLLQSYDSMIYPQEPEELAAQWGFYWSTDPKHAKPFFKASTSPYGKDDCCTFDGHVWRSTIPNNVWTPMEHPQGWEDLGLIPQS